MGLKGATNVLFNAKGLTMTALKSIARARFAGDDHLCHIDVDCIWLVGYKLGRSSSDGNGSMLTAKVLLLLAKAGFVFTQVCDPPLTSFKMNFN